MNTHRVDSFLSIRIFSLLTILLPLSLPAVNAQLLACLDSLSIPVDCAASIA